MKTKLLTLLLLAGCSLFARGHFSVGIGIGSYRYPYYAPVPVYYGPPVPVVAYGPPCPGPGYSWVSGYWYPAGRRHVWRAGYWTRRLYPRVYGSGLFRPPLPPRVLEKVSGGADTRGHAPLTSFARATGCPGSNIRSCPKDRPPPQTRRACLRPRSVPRIS